METISCEDVRKLCQALIRQPSLSGQEEGASLALQTYMKEQGVFDTIQVDDYGNTLASIKGCRPGPVVLFDGHIDTVPVEDETAWTYPPFAGEIHDGRLYGRGASDMKGALAAMTVGAVQFARKTGKDFAGTLYIAAVVHEECFEGVAARAISQAVHPDYVVIGEASGLDLKVGQRGRAEIVLESLGRSCHSANPEKGVNAVYKICKAISCLQQVPAPIHPVLGKGILELTDIKSSPYPGASVVPDYCRVTYDRRLLTGETKESVLAPLKKALSTLMEQDAEASYRLSYAVGRERCYTGAEIEGERFFPGWLYDKQADFVQAAADAMGKAGFTPAIRQYNFCTNGSHYAGEAHIPTLGLGHSREDLAHTVDEYIELSQLTGAVTCYMAVMGALLQERFAPGKGGAGA